MTDPNKPTPAYYSRDEDDYRWAAVLVGPDGWECCLGEPEDCNWARDGRAAVDRLNQQHAEIARLTADLEAKDKGYRDLHEKVHGPADIWTKVEWLLAERDEWKRRAIERGWTQLERDPHPARLVAARTFAAVRDLPEIPAPMPDADRAAILAAADAGRTRVVYLGCPVVPTAEQIAEWTRDSRPVDPALILSWITTANLARARRWLWWLRSHTAWSVCAPWIPAVQAAIDNGADEATERARGLADDLAVLGRCDAIVLCGGRISAGMAIERDHAIAHGLAVIDLSMAGPEPGGEAAGLITSPIAVRWRR